TANRAIDGSFENNGGNDQSRWVSNRNSNDEYIQIDLEANYDLTGVKLYWEGNGAKKYQILVSEDGKTWQK
ncbi:discoidin domain-containing protein, partial [Blautia faecis]